MPYTEANYENAIIDLFQSNMGYDYVYGPDIDRNFSSPLYDDVLEESLRRLNPKAPYDAIQDALLKLRNFENGELVQKNVVFNGLSPERRSCSLYRKRRGALYYDLSCGLENTATTPFIIAKSWSYR